MNVREIVNIHSPEFDPPIQEPPETQEDSDNHERRQGLAEKLLVTGIYIMGDEWKEKEPSLEKMLKNIDNVHQKITEYQLSGEELINAIDALQQIKSINLQILVFNENLDSINK